MTGFRATFDALEAGADNGNAEAKAVLAWISETIAHSFELSKEPRRYAAALPALDGSDACERVAEAMAVWIKESAPRFYHDAAGTRYQATGIDCSVEGMERLRDRDEFILLAYPSGEESAEDIADEFIRDLSAVGREDGFDYGAAESAIRSYCAAIAEAGYLGAKLAEFASYHSGNNPAGLPTDEDDSEPAPMRLYVRDNAPESDNA